MKSVAIFTGLMASSALAQPHGYGHSHYHNDKREMKTFYHTEWVTHTITNYYNPDDVATPGPNAGAHAPVDAEKPVPTSPAPMPHADTPVAEAPEEQAPAPAPTLSPANVQAHPLEGGPVSTPTPTLAVDSKPAAEPAYQAPAAATAADEAATGALTGDLTWFDIGLGSCGIDDTGKDNTVNVVAISHLLMGEQSNGNPMCGKTITISSGGKTVEAIVHDKCMGCAYSSIDVSKRVFTDLLGSLDIGRQSVEWWWN